MRSPPRSRSSHPRRGAARRPPRPRRRPGGRAARNARVHADPSCSADRACAQRLVACLNLEVERFEAPLAPGRRSRAARTAELGADLRRLGAEEVELRGAPPPRRPSALTRDRRRARPHRRRARRGAAPPRRAAGAEPAEGDDRDELAARLARLERRREQLGQVNPLAKEEYEAEKERLDELSTQRADLERSLEELEKLRRELTETVERRFEETFAAVEQHFAEVADDALPRRRGPPAADRARGRGRASPGSRSSSAPPASASPASRCSRAARRRSARSRSCSASSSRGRARSTSSTRSRRRSTTRTSAASPASCARYADRAQFIVVTHQKRTMEAADVLYGVTMGTDGVSQIVSRRLPHGRRSPQRPRNSSRPSAR